MSMCVSSARAEPFRGWGGECAPHEDAVVLGAPEAVPRAGDDVLVDELARIHRFLMHGAFSYQRGTPVWRDAPKSPFFGP